METQYHLIEWIDMAVKVLALIIGATWALYKIYEYREFKNCVQLDVGANIIRLNEPENASGKTWNKKGESIVSPNQKLTHAVEVTLKFSNKGKTRVKLYNIQIGINSMRPQGQAQFDKDDGHLHLMRLFTSGNIVKEFQVKDKPKEETSFYYIEPAVEQTITYLCLIEEPRELVQVLAKFSLEQKRLFPENETGPKGLYPHTAAKIFPINMNIVN